MLEKIELPESALVYLYNLLVPEVQRHVDEDKLQPDMALLLDETTTALERVTGEVAWFTCTKEECDHRPFQVTRDQLLDAEGVVTCEYCGQLCLRVPEQKLQPSLM